jgi:anti-anti-sigma regulatory factor
MVTKRKVTKKKVTKKPAARKSTSPAAKRVTSAVPKKKGVAAKRKPKTVSNVLALGEALVISGADEWKQKIADTASGHDEIILDGGEIEQIDAVGLQLLVSLMKTAVNRKATVTWRSASDALIDSAAKLGLSEILALDKLPKAE